MPRASAFSSFTPIQKNWTGMCTDLAPSHSGAQILSDSTTRFYEFSGATYGPTTPPNNGPTPAGPTSGDPVDLSTGIFSMRNLTYMFQTSFL